MRFAYLVIVLSALAGVGVPAAYSQSSDKAPPVKVSPEEVRALIRQLGAEDYFVRQEAQERLLGLGAAALDQLVEAAEQSDLEVAARARFLLRKIHVQWHSSRDPEPVVSWMKSYGQAPTGERAQLIRRLAHHYEGQGLASLCRIARFEADQGLAHLAGVLALRYPRPGPKYRRLFALAVQENLQGSRRLSALWLQQAVQDQQSGKPDQRFWAQAIGQQVQRYRASPSLLEMEILQQLLEYCWSVSELSRQEKIAQAANAAIDTMIRHGHENAGKSLALWLFRNRQWHGWNRLWPRLAQAVRDDPLMLYAAAVVHRRQGRTGEAQTLVQKIRALSLSTLERAQLAEKLYREKLYEEAVAEYRRAFEGPQNSRTVMIGYNLGLLLADLQRYDKAAQVAQRCIDVLQAQVPGARGDALVNTFRAKQWFWEALAQGQKQGRPNTELLTKTIRADLQELDAIIALYRAADRPEIKRLAVQFIQQSLSQIDRAIPRRIVRPVPNLATPFNQWAWLVSNTQGDYEKALEYSKRSLQLAPGRASYLDTLGRCYYALRRYEDAVAAQRLAVRLEPHYQQMQRQLQLFEEALARTLAEDKPGEKQGQSDK